MANQVYDPKDLIIVWGGKPLSGFATDQKVNIDFNEDKLSLEVGVDGDESVFTVNNDQQGKAEIVLFTSCETDKVLNAILELGEINSSLLIAPLSVTNIRTGAEWFAANAGISKRPGSAFGKGKSSTATYTFIYPKMIQSKGVITPTI